MRESSPLELNELYKNTLNRCGTFLLEESDEVIDYQIYDEFDIEVYSFLHEDSLKALLENGYISKEKFNMSKKLWEKYTTFMGTEEWQFKNFRTSKIWLEILQMGDELKKMK